MKGNKAVGLQTWARSHHEPPSSRSPKNGRHWVLEEDWAWGQDAQNCFAHLYLNKQISQGTKKIRSMFSVITYSVSCLYLLTVIIHS